MRFQDALGSLLGALGVAKRKSRRHTAIFRAILGCFRGSEVRNPEKPDPTAAVVVRGAASPYLLAGQVDERIEVWNAVCEKVFAWILNMPVAALGTAD